jgi:para-aminobenzoate synthetase component 1
VLRTKPIAGTRPRGATRERDAELERELLSSEKERAEHVMLVDLERNDLSRVAQTGSVEVSSLARVERYSHVMHLVSEIRARRRSGATNAEIVGALFPGGTITGCPKLRAIELIDREEPVARDIFYGSCGRIDGAGNLQLNILIRTLLCLPGMIIGQAGAGIVADSDPEREWHESLCKAQAQLRAIELAGSFARGRVSASA